MANNLQTFNSMQFGKVRTAGMPENPKFCLADICRALDLDSSQVMKRLDGEVVSIHPITDSLGRVQNAKFVNEDGLYDVILDSRKPEARKFRKWITSEVLPTIRKTGSYNLQRTPVANAVEDVGLVAENIQKIFPAVHHGMALTQAINLVEENASINLDSLRPLLPAAEHKTGYMNATMLGQKLGGLKARSVNKLLAANGFQYKESDGTWRLTEEGAAFGEERPYGNKDSGHYGYQILWSDGVIDNLKLMIDNDANNLSIELR